MADEKEVLKIRTPQFRGNYVNLNKPRAYGKGDPRYSILMALDEDHKFVAKMRRLEKKVAEERWGSVPKRMKSALKTERNRAANLEEGEEDQFEGKVTVSFAAEERPGVVFFDEDGDLVQVDDPKMLFSGAWYMVTTRPYAWDHPEGGKGVSWSLDNVLWVKSDESFTSRTTAEQDFKNIKDELDLDEDEEDDEDLM